MMMGEKSNSYTIHLFVDDNGKIYGYVVWHPGEKIEICIKPLASTHHKIKNNWG